MSHPEILWKQGTVINSSTLINIGTFMMTLFYLFNLPLFLFLFLFPYYLRVVTMSKVKNILNKNGNEPDHKYNYKESHSHQSTLKYPLVPKK